MKNSKKLLTGIIGIIIGIIIALLPAPSGLSRQAMIVLGSVVTANIFWIGSLIPNVATGLIMISLWAVAGIVTFEEAFGVFSKTTWWIIVGGLGIGFAATKSGLIKRISLHIMKLFPVSFTGQSLALLSSGILVAPGIPSTNAKGVLAAPIARSINKILGNDEPSKESAGLFMAAFWGFIVSGPIFLSATSTNYAIKGLLPQAIQEQLSWGGWLKISIVWGILLMVAGFLVLNLIYKPKNEKKLDKKFINDQIKELGPMSRDEKITGIVLLITLFFWMMERTLNINASLTAVISLSILMAFNVITPKEFNSSTGWNVSIFIGCAMTLGTVLGLVGVSDWIKETLGGVISPLLSNPLYAVIAIPLIIFIAKFALVSLITASTVFLLIFVPFFETISFSPLVLVFIVATSINIWFLPYMNPPFLTTHAAVNNNMLRNKDAMITSLIYLVLNIGGLLVSLLYWKAIGLI